MELERYTDIGITDFTECVHKEMDPSVFIYHAADIYRTWQKQHGSTLSLANLSCATIQSIAGAQEIWIENHQDCIDMLYEAVAAVQKQTDQEREIPRCISAFLQSVYEDLDEIIHRGLRGVNGRER